MTGVNCSDSVHGCDVFVDTTAGKACFLGGIAGNFNATDFGGYVSVYDNGAGQYRMTVWPQTGHVLGAQAQCIAPATNKASMHWETGWAPTQLGGGTTKRRCFLTQILTSNHAMTDFADSAEVFTNGPSAYVLLGYTSEVNSYMSLNAVCFDDTSSAGDFSYRQQGAGTITHGLAPSAGGTACGLTEPRRQVRHRLVQQRRHDQLQHAELADDARRLQARERDVLQVKWGLFAPIEQRSPRSNAARAEATMRLIYVAASVMVAGCAVDNGDDAAPTGEIEQDVTSTALASWSCDGHANPCNFNLGTATNRACFLSGVRGAASGGTDGSMSGIWIDANNNYELAVYTSPANPLIVGTTCVTPGAHKLTAHWELGNGWPAQVQIPGTTASSRCFLSQFGAYNGMRSYGDSVSVSKDSNGVWWLTGSSTTGFVDADAICFDATDIGDWGWGQTSGTISGNLASNLGGGVACGLTALGGSFLANSDGMWIDFSARGVGQWLWTFVGAKHAGAECIR